MTTVDLTDEEIFVVRAALETAYDSWRKENGPAWEYVANEVMRGLEKKLPETSKGMTAETIFTDAKDGEMLLDLRRLESAGKLTSTSAARLLQEARERDDELKDY